MPAPSVLRRSGLLVLVAAALTVPTACSVGDADQSVAVEDAMSSPSDPTEVSSERGRSEDELRRQWEEACGDAPADTACGVTHAERNAMNRRHADRIDFAGDMAEATAEAESIRVELAELAKRSPTPTEEELAAALASHPEVSTSSNAVGMPAPAFSVGTAGGCIFGWVHDGEVSVDIGGPVNDGGCLASYGH